MAGDWLALGAIAALAAVSAARRGSRNDCSGPFFHTTTWDRLQSIAEGGLEIGYGSRFGGWYQGHSRGRIFVGQGAWEAGKWFDTVSSAVEMSEQIKEQGELATVVPVMLRLDLEGMDLRVDTAAAMDRMDCSFYVTETIEPEQIWFYDGTAARWRPIDEWDQSDPMTAFRDWAFESDDEPDAYGERQEWIVFNTKNRDWESGVFAPQRHNDPAAEQSWEDQKGSRNRTVAGELAVRYAHPYVSPRQRRLTAGQGQVRRTAYMLKSDDPVGQHVADDLARLLTDVTNPVLVPIPDSRGATTKNRALAQAVAHRIRGAVVCDVLSRSEAVQSSRLQRRAGRSSLSPSRHRMVALSDCPGPVFFVDNVATTGNTLRAAKAALRGRGEGLVWAAHLARLRHGLDRRGSPSVDEAAGSVGVTDWSGREGWPWHTTRRQRGMVLTSEIAHLGSEGGEVREWWVRNGERRFGNYSEARWQEFLSDIDRRGVQVPIEIWVKPGKPPQIREGNHRLQAALQLGLRKIPVIIDYYGHTQRKMTVAPSARRILEGTAPGSPNAPAFVVRSPSQGAKLIEHPEITANHRKALRVKPKHSTAVLVPCAGTKPFPQSPSHKHGYLPALAGKKVDTYIVSEPLGVVPYAWSDTYPNNAYDFPPEHLKGRAFDLLVARVGEWLDKVGTKYRRIVLALPAHHMRLVKKALVGRDLPVEEAGVGACKADGACGTNVYRATHTGYKGWLGKRVAGSAAKKWWSWDEAWWTGSSKSVFIDGEGGRIYAVGHRMVLVFNSDLARVDFDPGWRWTFKINHNNKINELRMTNKMRTRYRRGFPDRSAYRSTPDPMESLIRRVRSDLQSALDRARSSE